VRVSGMPRIVSNNDGRFMNLTEGAYRSGESFLHQLDPRVKLLLLPGLITCLFSASTPQRLLLIACLWFVAAGATRRVVCDLGRIVKMLRWLLFFTLIVHLLFTPGHTLFGTSWLSYDGLLRGLMIDMQLILAVLFSLLLAWTTRPEALAAALTFLLNPLQRLGLPVKEAGGMLLLVLHFFPYIQSEVTILKSERSQEGGGMVAGIRGWVSQIDPLITRLFDYAEDLAHRIATGEEAVKFVETPSKTAFDRSALIALALGVVLITLLWQV